MNEAYVEALVKRAFRRAYEELAADRSGLPPEVIHVTELTYCLRKSYWERQYGINYSDEKLVILGLGQAAHYIVEEFIGGEAVKEQKVEYDFGEFVLTGKPDLILDDAVVELKTTSTFPAQPFEHHIVQLQVYLHLLDRRYGFIVYIDKRRGGVKAYRVERRDEYWVKIADRARKFYLALKNNQPPPPEPSPLCRYCEFREKCKQVLQEVVV